MSIIAGDKRIPPYNPEFHPPMKRDHKGIAESEVPDLK
jgi:hypothetical protein